MLTWVLASYMHRRKVSVVGAAAGAVAGLVAITPASGFVSAGGAVLIGLAAGGVCYSATLLRERLRIDDALDVFAVHGVGGAFGALATGVFATVAVNPAGTDGLLAGNAGLIGTQLLGVLVVAAYSAVATAAILTVINLIVPIRVTAPAEEAGLDLAQHGEIAYQP
jgi:Amt family ammonium transporter